MNFRIILWKSFKNSVRVILIELQWLWNILLLSMNTPLIILWEKLPKVYGILKVLAVKKMILVLSLTGKMY